MRIRSIALSLVFFLFAAPTFAQLTFRVGTAGTATGVNNWPAGEAPGFAIDGVSQKYLNFGKFNTGVAVSPDPGAAAPTSIRVWTANDSENRDPIFFSIYGTNAAASGAPGTDLADLNLIATGSLALPTGRNNPGGSNPLNAAFSASSDFINTTSFPTYVVVFPSVKNSTTANSMQIAEVQLFDAGGGGLFAPTNSIVGGQLVPEPSTILLALSGLISVIYAARRCRK